jgi:hypothetical protein
MSTLRTLGKVSTRMSFRRRMDYKIPSPTSVMSTVSFPKDDDEDDFFRSTQQHQNQRRSYHQTARNEVLYPAIIILAALSYVGTGNTMVNLSHLIRPLKLRTTIERWKKTARNAI